MNITVTNTAEIACPDGETLSGRWYRALNGSPRAIVVVAPAAAVSAKFYHAFCEYLAGQNWQVLCFDFSAIGHSKRRDVKADHAVGFSTWIERDYPAVIRHAKQTHPNLPLLIVGHSAGGWMAGLHALNQDIDGILGVAALSGYWKWMARPNRYLHFLTWHMIVPISVWLKGYWPGVVGLKINLPRTLGLEFARWAKHPEFVFGETNLNAKQHARDYCGHLQLLQIRDDPWGTVGAVSNYAKYFTGAKTNQIMPIDPMDFGLKRLGHFGFFRKNAAPMLWAVAAKKLEDML